MRTVHIATLASVVFLTLLVACESTSDPVAPKLQAMSFANSEWSAPVNLGSTINTTFNEQGPTLSNDGLSLYFGSDHPSIPRQAKRDPAFRSMDTCSSSPAPASADREGRTFTSHTAATRIQTSVGNRQWLSART